SARLDLKAPAVPRPDTDHTGPSISPASMPMARSRGLPRAGGSGLGRDRVDYSALTPANFTTLPHFSVSSAMSLPKSATEPGSAVAPHSASRAFNLGSARAALISVLSLSTISAGALRGAPIPVQKLNS